jgi:hypothetical protein
MKKPVSDRPLAANRANAALNSRQHGFTASTLAVVRLEDIDEVAHLRQDAIAVYQPVNSQELFAIERIALSQQALRHELPNEPILEVQPEVNNTVSTPEPNPRKTANPSPAGNIPGQPPRFRPNPEPFLIPPQVLPPDAPKTPSPDPGDPLGPPRANK